MDAVSVLEVRGAMYWVAPLIRAIDEGELVDREELVDALYQAADALSKEP